MAEDKQFYVGQKAFINKEGEILVLFDPILGMDYPGGKIQEGETDFDKALKREVSEETGLDIEVGDPFARWYFEFGPGHRNSGKKVFLVGYKCIYKSGKVKLSDEHNNYKWVNKDNYKELDDGSDYFKVLDNYFNSSQF